MNNPVVLHNLAIAVGVLNSLLSLGVNAWAQTQRVSALINRAIQEDRDLNDDEITEVWLDRQAAMQRWNTVKEDEAQ